MPERKVFFLGSMYFTYLFQPIINRCFLLLLSSCFQLVQTVDQVNDFTKGKWDLKTRIAVAKFGIRLLEWNLVKWK